MRRFPFPLLLAAAVFGAGFLAAPVPAQVAEGAAQSSSARGVTVKVTPRSLAPGAGTWSFAVVLDTHSEDLADDVLQTTQLVTDDGRTLRPVAWKGAGPGGHHRQGTLEFAAPQPSPKAFELRMQRTGEPDARVFRFAP